MTKFKRKISAILLTLAMVFTMMPSMALTAFADDAAYSGFEVRVNNVTVDSVSVDELTDNPMQAQIFSFAGNFKEGGKFNYTIAEGPSYESILKEKLAINDLNEITNAELQWLTAEGTPANNFKLSVKDLVQAKSVFKLTNGTDDNEITGKDVASSNNLYAVQRTDAGTVTPIIAYREKTYATYVDAKTALDNTETPWTSGATTDVRAYVGGIIRDEDVWLKKDGDTAKGTSFNWVGKFAITNPSVLNVIIAPPTDPEKASLKMKVGDAAKRLNSTKYTDKELELLGVIWECTDAEVVNLDATTGTVTPLKAGTSKVTATVYKEGTTEVISKIGEWDITVESNAPAVKPAPAMPTSLKVKNVKKKTAKLSWKAAANAEGYEVYRSTKKKKGFKMVASVSGNSYKNKKLKKGKTYYFKVRSFNTVNGKKVYSGYSAVKKVKIKK